jgi:threonine dehydratase
VPTSADIAAAVERCRPLVRRTPVLWTTPGDLGLSESVTLKLESLQHAGSFKARGSLNTALGLGVPAGGLIAASGGNHGIAVARTAQVLGVKAEIFVPGVSSPAKIDRLRAQGAMVNIVGELYDDAQEACDARAASIDALKIHP